MCCRCQRSLFDPAQQIFPSFPLLLGAAGPRHFSCPLAGEFSRTFLVAVARHISDVAFALSFSHHDRHCTGFCDSCHAFFCFLFIPLLLPLNLERSVPPGWIVLFLLCKSFFSYGGTFGFLVSRLPHALSHPASPLVISSSSSFHFSFIGQSTLLQCVSRSSFLFPVDLS